MEFNYDKFTEDVNYIVDAIKENIKLSTHAIKNNIDEDRLENYKNEIERSATSLINIYIGVSKVYENLSKNKSVPSSSNLKSYQKIKSPSDLKLDKLFDIKDQEEDGENYD